MTLFRRKKKFVINEPDPEYNVIYLGNVLTVLAKGDGCVDKPLSLIWRTYCSRTRPDLPMTLAVTNAGLKANTKQQGLTEYWAHRITFCVAPAQYKRVFCWVYKHEGKKLKPELRCHAVLCRKDELPVRMTSTLTDRIGAALRDYKREKISRQNLRLAASRHPAVPLPLRRLLLSTGGQNFRPPMTRSKSAPKLHSIDEEDLELAEEAEDGESDPDSTTIANLNILRAQISVESESDGYFETISSFYDNNNIGRRDSTFSQMQIVSVDDDLVVDELGVGNLKIEESDSVSDESGYHEEKASLEDEVQKSDEENVVIYYADDIEITSL